MENASILSIKSGVISVGNTESDNAEATPKTNEKYQIPAAQLFLQKGHITKFETGSSFAGSWNHIGVTAAAIYRYPDGMIYEGRLRDGQFDGYGTLLFPQGHAIIGHWANGIAISMSFIFADGLKFTEPEWTYCQDGDRRYAWDEFKSLPPVGQHNVMVNRRSIPENCYDTGEGFYNPKTKCLYDAQEPTRILRIPTATEEQWIIAECPKSWSETIGYRKDLIEGNVCEGSPSRVMDFSYIN